MVIGKHSFSADLGVVQGGVLSPMLFNIYLEEALGTTQKLREMVIRGDLLAFADDMLILTNSKAEMTKAIQELDALSGVWNLRLNKAKSQVLTEDTSSDIAGVPCVNQVKYLGVPICLDQKIQREKCIASIKRNLGHLRWKLRKVDLDIKETLTCVLARSILVYTGTPLVAAGLWKREDIDRIEAQLFREVNNLPNVISNKAILNVACSMRNAWEIVEPLALRANLQAKRQKQIKPQGAGGERRSTHQ